MVLAPAKTDKAPDSDTDVVSSPIRVATDVRAPKLSATRVRTEITLPNLPETLDPKSVSQDALLESVLSGERLSPEGALWLLQHGETEAIRSAADQLRLRRFPDDRATFIIDRNINYTNICVIKCSFCAFYRLPGSPEGYRRSMENIFERIDEAIAQGATQIMFRVAMTRNFALSTTRTSSGQSRRGTQLPCIASRHRRSTILQDIRA